MEVPGNGVLQNFVTLLLSSSWLLKRGVKQLLTCSATEKDGAFFHQDRLCPTATAPLFRPSAPLCPAAASNHHHCPAPSAAAAAAAAAATVTTVIAVTVAGPLRCHRAAVPLLL